VLKDDEVKAIAKLARIEIDNGDIPAFAKDLSQIIGFIAQMNTIDTHDVEPLAHPLEPVAVLRPDEVTETNNRDLYQSGAPQIKGGLYLVPKVID
jgi:aspartyl-tRNA(Asn)/glutamyl-tRNA(Gln) amidotransferase subunit C